MGALACPGLSLPKCRDRRWNGGVVGALCLSWLFSSWYAARKASFGILMYTKKKGIHVLDKSALLHCRPSIMQMNKIIRSSVGADLSRPQPIYRPSVDVPISRLFCYKSIIKGRAKRGFALTDPGGEVVTLPTRCWRTAYRQASTDTCISKQGATKKSDCKMQQICNRML